MEAAGEDEVLGAAQQLSGFVAAHGPHHQFELALHVRLSRCGLNLSATDSP